MSGYFDEIRTMGRIEMRNQRIQNQLNADKKGNNVNLKETRKPAELKLLSQARNPTILEIPSKNDILDSITDEDKNTLVNNLTHTFYKAHQHWIEGYENLSHAQQQRVVDRYTRGLHKYVNTQMPVLLDIMANEKLVSLSNQLNTSTNPQRFPNETDTDYLQRLEGINLNMPDTDQIIALSAQKERDLLLQNFKRFLNPIDANEAINFPIFANNDKINLLNKTFVRFEDKIRKTFSKIDTETLKAYIDWYFENLAKEMTNDKKDGRIRPPTFGTKITPMKEPTSSLNDFMDEEDYSNMPQLENELIAEPSLYPIAEEVEGSVISGLSTGATTRNEIEAMLKNNNNTKKELWETVGRLSKDYPDAFDSVLSRDFDSFNTKSHLAGVIATAINNYNKANKEKPMTGYGLKPKPKKGKKTIRGRGLSLPEKTALQRFNVLMGELGIGNNSRILRKELKDLTQILLKNGLITKQQAKTQI